MSRGRIAEFQEVIELRLETPSPDSGRAAA